MVSWWRLASIFVALLHAKSTLTKCIERDYEIQSYLASSTPPFDNYLNISRAVYPSVDLPSLRIKITVEFLSTTNNVTQSGSSPTNITTASMKNMSDARLTTSEVKKYTWSMSCLYVSAGPISLRSMNIFSLWAIWPNRRETKLHLTLPQFCKGATQSHTMFYFLSTLEDIAVKPSVPDPSLNKVECVTIGHEKAPSDAFSGLKQYILHNVCWCLLGVAFVTSTLASQWLVVKLSEWNGDEHKSRRAAIMIMCLLIFFGGLVLSSNALCIDVSSGAYTDEHYSLCFLIIVLFVLFRRLIFCCIRNKCKEKHFEYALTLGHGNGSDFTTNVWSCSILYPAVFMTCHHVLWIMLGIITEPFWAVSVLVSFISVSAIFCFLICELHKVLCESCPLTCDKKQEMFDTVMIVINVLLAAAALVVLILVLLVVSQAFLSESLVATIVQNGLVMVFTMWIGYLGLKKVRGKERVTEASTGERRKKTSEEEIKEEAGGGGARDGGTSCCCCLSRRGERARETENIPLLLLREQTTADAIGST